MLGATIVFPLVGVFAGFVGVLIIREGTYVGYQLAPEATRAIYIAGQVAMILNLIHAFAWGALSARRVFRAIASA